MVDHLPSPERTDGDMSPWLQAGLSLAIGLLTAGGALLGVRWSAKVNDRANLQHRREEWWRRFVWAANLALDESQVKRVVGLKLLTKLAQSDLAQQDECQLIDVFQGRVLDSLLDEPAKPQKGVSTP
jgi:hypothetical protein